jgi:hypothetical protein
MRGIIIASIAITVACGGSDEPEDVAGNYTVAVTNRENGCNLANWNVGEMATGILVTVTQNDANATALVEGGTGAYLMFVLGSRSFTGSVDGNHLDLTLVGTNSATTGNCTYTYNAVLDARLDGDALVGEIAYRPQTNDQSDCAPFEGCASIQGFNGIRPPPP